MARTSTILLLTGDYYERLSDLADEAREAELSGGRRVADKARYKAIREEYEALRAEAEDAGVRVTLQSIGRAAWRQIKADHPPRIDGDESTIKADRIAGVNLETVEDDLLYASVVEPEFKSRAAFDEWADSLSQPEFQTLVNRAWELLTTVRTDPKSLPASPTRSSDET